MFTSVCGIDPTVATYVVIGLCLATLVAAALLFRLGRPIQAIAVLLLGLIAFAGRTAVLPMFTDNCTVAQTRVDEALIQLCLDQAHAAGDWSATRESCEKKLRDGK